MKKITSFIIDKRYFILAIFIVFSIICAININKVNINYEISKYLPSDSETRIGLDIMEQKFQELKSSNLNVMFKDLEAEQKNKIFEELKNIEGVASVDYDASENYNKDEYTLYVINIDDVNDSKLAADLYNQVVEKYKDYTIYTSGNISTRNAPVLPFYVIAIAVLSALVILIIMCESYTEPFLFLVAILIGVLLNKGTNIIFSSVSNITDSIAAILQMALSMDYSIMLMNRYRQEHEKEPNKTEAMKQALYKAFSSISSSSVTTIVGLIVLVFMSFTIGKDLGFVLAKGVLFSLISIFFVLPTLILWFDKLIEKTKKKTPVFKLNKAGSISYKCRYIAVPIFLLVFVGSYFAQGTLKIAYSNSDDNEVAKIFEEQNKMAIVYKSEDEEKIAKYLKEIENNQKVDEVLGYSNTINQKLKYNEMNSKFKDFDSDVEIEDYLLKLIYYKYYNNAENNEMTFSEFVSFIKNDVYKNKKLNGKLDDKIKSDIDRLEYFVTTESIDKKRSTSEIAQILDIDKSKVDDLMIYYNSKNNSTTISILDFLNFMNKDVLTNEKFSGSIDKNSKESLNELSKFASKSTIQKKISSKEMANLFGIDEETIKDLYVYYTKVNSVDTKLTLNQFVEFVLNDVASNSKYSDSIDENNMESLKMLKVFSNKSIIESEMNSSQLASLFGLNEDNVKQILLVKEMSKNSTSKYTLLDFATRTIEIKNNTHYLDDVDISNLKQLAQMLASNGSSEDIKYSPSELSSITGVPAEQINKIYTLIDFYTGNTSNWKCSPNNFVDFILNTDSIKASLSNDVITKLTLVSNIMKSALNEVKYSYIEMSNFIGIDADTTKSIFSLYVANNTNIKITPIEFVNFILKHQNDSILSGKISNQLIDKLKVLQAVMNGVVNNKKYTSQELSNLLGISKDKLDLLYGLYITKYVDNNSTISLSKFIDFVLEDVATNPEYSSNFDNESLSKLNIGKGIMNGTRNNTKYSKDELFAILSGLANSVEKNTIDVMYVYYGSQNAYDENWTITIEEFVNYINDNILQDKRFSDFIDDDMKSKVKESKTTINDAKELLIGDGYSRIIINTKYDLESDETSEFIKGLKDLLGSDMDNFYIVGDSAMAYEMNQSFDKELKFITILTMIAIFIVVAVTFKSIIIPLILVLIIQCAVYLTMGFLSLSGENVYFIALLIVQSILMGATIDYAILYTSYYLEHRNTMGIKESIINAYNNSMHTIMTSASILIIVTLIVGSFASAVSAKICKTISKGTLCSTILILVLLPAILAAFDKIIVKKKKDKRHVN